MRLLSLLALVTACATPPARNVALVAIASSAPDGEDHAGDGIDADGDGLDCETDVVDGRRLIVCLDDVNHDHAARLCSEAGYRLAVVDGERTQLAIEKLLERAGALYTDAPWIAAKVGDAGFQHFYAGEPSGDGECVHLNWPLGMGTWNDAGCYQHEAWAGFVCEGAPLAAQLRQ